MTVRHVDAAEAVALAADGRVVIDVREPVEWEGGHVAGAVNIPIGELGRRIQEIAPDRSTPLLLHCASGVRSGRGATLLEGIGYTDVVNLDAPIGDWAVSGGRWDAPVAAGVGAARYGRQVLLPEVGASGQTRLGNAGVLVVGAGGLGSPAALYLAAAGIGTLGLVDDDLVEESNLHRQPLHATDRIGMAKVASGERALRALNPETAVVTHRERVTEANVDRLVSGYDVVVDGTDNLETRYVLNDAAVRLGVPVVHGSVYRWDGQVTTFVPGVGPCYRCMHPEPPPDGVVLDCDVAGVLGVLPGIVGTLQAAEAIKLVLGVGEPLVGRLLMVDALRGTTDEIRVPRDSACSSCGNAVEAASAAALA